MVHAQDTNAACKLMQYQCLSHLTCSKRGPSCRIKDSGDASVGQAVMVVNEKAQTVTVQAGVPQRDLLDYLAKYT